MIVDIRVRPEDKDIDSKILKSLYEVSNLEMGAIKQYKLLKSSIDCRQKIPIYQLRFEVSQVEELPNYQSILESFEDVSNKPEIHIIGAGPAGYFAALECIQNDLKPIVWERGLDARSRRRDLKGIQQDHIVNPESNYCFGEGGAGTYSDGKLYTRSTKRGDIEKVLKLFYEHGAAENILTESHPHIGSNKLPQIISKIRETIIARGGQVHFNSRLNDIIVQDGKVRRILVNDFLVDVNYLILCTGHSARDVYQILHDRNVLIESKPFAIGVRVEHPQALIDQIQYKNYPLTQFLPPAAYSLTCHTQSKGVFSFCMCPGGLIIPAATNPGEIVVNGMSLSRRDSPYANSGIVVEVNPITYPAFSKFGVLAGIKFQENIEQNMFSMGNKTQSAPAQKMTDFVHRKTSSTLNPSSYIPGLISRDLNTILPSDIAENLRKAFVEFGVKMKGYFCEEANIIGVESRTSAPIKIPRNIDTYQHTNIEGLYPCGEGAGYAGGIVSAAVDGQNVVRAIAQRIK